MTDEELEKLADLIADKVAQRLQPVQNPKWPVDPFQPKTIPGYPIDPGIMPTIPEKPSCSKCGMIFDGVMGYVCSQPDCPSGCGPIMCKS